jgi:hypothetical protein
MKTVIFPIQKVANHDTVPTIMGLEQEKILSEAEVKKLRMTVQNEVLEELVKEIKVDIEESKNRPLTYDIRTVEPAMQTSLTQPNATSLSHGVKD